MVRDPRTFLWDARESAGAILCFLDGISLEQYSADAMRRAAVERHFTIIGEALGRLAKLDSELAARVPNLAKAVAFRNLLVHGYELVENRAVWRTAQVPLVEMRAVLGHLIKELERKPD